MKKKVLVVGANSYIGSSFERYAQGRLDVTMVGSYDDEWQALDYSVFDSVVYVAGIAHRKQTAENKDLYFTVNRDLAVSVAKKAKFEGAGQFIYFSSIYAFGEAKGEINKNTIPSHPKKDYYGLSKYQAEKMLELLQSDSFKVAFVRPPMVYGPGCRGNFPLLIKISKAFPFVPTVDNKRSMIFIDNLAEFLAIAIEQRVSGVLCPQNKEYVSTVKMMEEISELIGKKTYRLPFLNFFILIFSFLSTSLQSAFGSLYYSNEVSKMPFEQEYQLVGFKESVRKSIKEKDGCEF